MKRNQIVLIVDGAGRGAALVEAYGKSKFVKKIIATPGNDLMAKNTNKKVVIYPDIKTTDVEKIVEVCKSEKVTFVDIAQEDGVEAGVADATIAQGIPTIGLTKRAGQLEWDKAWSRQFMWKYKIPHPTFKVFKSQKEGITFLKKEKNQAWFVKAAGLVGGKGALPADSNEEAIKRIKELSKFGKAGETYLLEQWLIGEEFSAFAIADGKTVRIVGYAQDHKRQYNFDLGENTGGIGCSTPPQVVTSSVRKQAEEIIKQTIAGMTKEERIYKGILYLGGIVVKEKNKDKVYVIEYNSRWGDPEAEVLVPGIKSDLYQIGYAVTSGRLKTTQIKTDNKARVAVTGSLKPGENAKNGKRRIYGLEKALKTKEITVYGTRVFLKDKKYYVSEGRLFHVVAEGKTVVEAREKAYKAMAGIHVEGNNLHYRTDIGFRDVERLTKRENK